MEEPGHGHSVAAWTGVALLLTASLLLSIGIYFVLPWANWAGIVLTVVGVAAWYGLNRAGYGEQTHGRREQDGGGATRAERPGDRPRVAGDRGGH